MRTEIKRGTIGISERRGIKGRERERKREIGKEIGLRPLV